MAQTYQDTNVNQLVINKMTKQEYDNLQQVSKNELYLVEEQVDSVVTQDSINPVQSGAVYEAFQSLTAAKANKIVPKYTSKELTTVSAATTNYIKLADCTWVQTGTLQVYLSGVDFEDTLIINFGGGNARIPMLCGYYTSNSNSVHSVIAERGSKFDDNYSICIKTAQITTCTVNVAVLNGDCTVNISETTTAPTNISEWIINRGIFGTFYGNLTGNVTGNSDTATKATQDASGNVITSTYATKTELNKVDTKLSEKANTDDISIKSVWTGSLSSYNSITKTEGTLYLISD